MRTAVQSTTSFEATPSPLVRAAQAESERCAGVLTLAFSADPACRWAWPDSQQYLEAFPQFVRAFGGRAFEADAAYRLDDYRAVALWLPPGESPDQDALTAVIERSAERELRDALFQLFEEMEQYHPREAHWHLPLIGVDPAVQSKGHGSVLLRSTLTRCDREQLPAYLEATSPRNVPFYARHGFRALGEIRVAGSPPIVPMLRRPRRVAVLSLADGD